MSDGARKRGYKDPMIVAAAVATFVASTLNLINVVRPLAIAVGAAASALWILVLARNIRNRKKRNKTA